MSQESEVHDPQQQHSEEEASGQLSAVAAEAGGRFVGQWNRLISTTNWEKGRIICQWREALMAAGAPVTQYSDESWAQLVGGVTSQHVGRLRRVFQRFGDVYDQYDGLFWSHFQAALDWDDAEMWLEGAIRNEFSVSQMRGKRWETLGNTGDPPEDSSEDLSGEDASEEAAVASDESSPLETNSSPRAEQTTVHTPKSNVSEAESDAAETEHDADDGAAASDDSHNNASTSAPRRDRPKVEVDDLPDDLAEAFEQFKLAIIAHRRSNWRTTSQDAVIECLDALREIALAPLD